MGIPKRKQFSLLFFLPTNTLLSLKLSATPMFGVFAQISFGRTAILKFIFHDQYAWYLIPSSFCGIYSQAADFNPVQLTRFLEQSLLYQSEDW